MRLPIDLLTYYYDQRFLLRTDVKTSTRIYIWMSVAHLQCVFFSKNYYSLTTLNQSYIFVCVFEGHLDDDTLHFMSMPRCGVRDKVGFATDSRSRRYALQGKYYCDVCTLLSRD